MRLGKKEKINQSEQEKERQTDRQTDRDTKRDRETLSDNYNQPTLLPKQEGKQKVFFSIVIQNDSDLMLYIFYSGMKHINTFS